MTDYRATVTRTQFVIFEFSDEEMEDMDDPDEWAYRFSQDVPGYEWEDEDGSYWVDVEEIL
jgi:hypothetical protein